MVKNIRALFFLVLSFCCFGGCGTHHLKTYRIGMDPSWFPLDTANREANLFAFTNDLLKEIALRGKVRLERVSMSWDNLLDGLKLGRYDAVLTSMKPTIMNAKQYLFSDLILKTGPVLILPIQSEVKGLDELDYKILLVSKGSWILGFMSNYPDIELQFYTYVTDALEDLLKNKAYGTLVPLIPASTYVQDRYFNELKIVANPLLDEGIRLVSNKGKDTQLLDIFNKAIEEMKKDGSFQKLLEKWSLPIQAL
jgi:polar amino acid transport system substrate-binding protein